MWRNLVFDLALGTSMVAAWYFIGLHLNRKRSMTIIYWIDEAIHGSARIAGLEWLSPSHFSVKLRFSENHFKRAILHVRLYPWELPVRWLLSRLRKTQETMTFEADLVTAPSFNLTVQPQRWTNRGRPFPKLEHHSLEHLGPFVVTTRREWQTPIVNVMDSLSSTSQCEFLEVTYNPATPNFTATLPLSSLRPGSGECNTVFDTMRELAIGASTSRT